MIVIVDRDCLLLIVGQRLWERRKPDRWDEQRPQRLGFGMLFHNRPVKAAMGSVIANGGVQLSDGKSLVKTKLATLHFGGRVKMS